MRTTTIAAVGLLSVALGGCGSDDESDSSNGRFELLEPGSAHDGKSYTEWNAEWFKWVLELQLDDECRMPLDDATGANCDMGQPDDMFFLAGNMAAGSTTVVRDDCVAPAGKPLFYPLMNTTADNAGVPSDQQLPDEELRSSVVDVMAKVDAANLMASVDGEAIPDLERFETDVAEFSYDVPDEPNFYSCLGASGVTGTVDPSYAAGYYVMLAPLSPGTHEIRFGFDQPDDFFTSEIIYNLTVE